MPKVNNKIIVHCLVRNEEKWIWYSIKSVIDYVDKIFVWDTGSTDNTVEIVNTIKSPKLEFRHMGKVDIDSFTDIRQRMIGETPESYTWLMILDGDEIWPLESIRIVTAFARSHPEYESIVVRTNNLVGDIYHRLPESAGMYNLAGRKGHLNLRFMNLKNIPDLHAQKPHGQQGYYDSQNTLIQNRDLSKIKFIEAPYHHATHLQRSINRLQDQTVIKRKNKLKYELGEKIPKGEIPEIFFADHPKIVPTVSQPATRGFWFKSALLTPFKRIKRKLLAPSHGY